jgi:FAD/FMN-containing dehydrogenase
MSASEEPDTSDLVRDLAAVVGREYVLTDKADRVFYSHDVYGIREVAACVARPATVEQLVRVVALASGRGRAVVARGGGSSYTGGFLPDRAGSVLVDTRRLDRIVELSAEDMYVTVECGVTWKQLYERLRERGLRTPFWGPLSGGTATVGGALSQNAILWGSARYGVSSESVLGIEVVLADGSLLVTGSASTSGARPFFRHYGPDLTGLFLGDTGALGIKASATLRLIRLPASFEAASFGFPGHEALVAAMAAIAREGLASECFAMDPELQRQRMKRAGLAGDLRALKGVLTSAPSLVGGFRQAARVALAGRSFLDDVDYSLHVCTEGRDAAGVRAAMSEIRRVAGASGGHELESTIPRVLRGDPFVPMTSAIGPEGERWAPVHGIVPLSDAAATWSAVRRLFAEHGERMQRDGVVIGILSAIVGGTALVIEPVFYWPGPRTPYYERVLGPEALARFRHFPESREAARTVAELRQRLVELFLSRGAAHFQIGKTYLYREGRRPEAWKLLEAIKTAVDPRRLMNPGSLGLE